MKRTRVLDMATSLMLLERDARSAKRNRFSSDSGRVFTCKTCDRQFASFQALGGHRASHTKPNRTEGHQVSVNRVDSPVKLKTHECSICGLEFAIGQALGGHMRKHRNAAAAAAVGERLEASPGPAPAPAPVAVLKKCSSKRVLCLDLNLTPLENDLKLHFGLVL